jgi:Ras-related protein Rab-7A
LFALTLRFSVGKTSLLYFDKPFGCQHSVSIAPDYLIKSYSIDHQIVQLQIWDTAGQERFRCVSDGFYRGASVCVLIYDITNAVSFQNLQFWMEQFNQHNMANRNESTPIDSDCESKCDIEPHGRPLPFVVLGNKSDLSSTSRQVSIETAQAWCATKGNISFFETSAKDSSNIDQAFSTIAKLALDRGSAEQSA